MNPHETYYKDLAAVTTLREASRLWGINYWTMKTWVNEGTIVAIKAPGTGVWLLSVRYLSDRFGFPPNLDNP